MKLIASAVVVVVPDEVVVMMTQLHYHESVMMIPNLSKRLQQEPLFYVFILIL
jgi:hypothetical protein